MGVPARSLNCFEGCGFLVLASMALGMGAMRVPRPAAGIMTITFIAGCKYTSARGGSSNPRTFRGMPHHHSRHTMSEVSWGDLLHAVCKRDRSLVRCHGPTALLLDGSRGRVRRC